MSNLNLTAEQRDELERVILARLEAKSEHMYQWPRWPAAYEAAEAVAPLVARMIADAEQRGHDAQVVRACGCRCNCGEEQDHDAQVRAEGQRAGWFQGIEDCVERHCSGRLLSNPYPRRDANETRHCDGCGEDYDPFEESHVGHEVATRDCPTCTGSSRETVGMVCQTCGTDYRADDPDAQIRADERERIAQAIDRHTAANARINAHGPMASAYAKAARIARGGDDQ